MRGFVLGGEKKKVSEEFGIKYELILSSYDRLGV